MIRKEFDFFTVEADAHETYVEFTVYEGIGFLEQYAEDLKADEPPLMVGSIKWDGCSNWNFDHKNYPLHFCSRMQARAIGELFASLYDWAAELMPDHKKDILE